MTAEQETQLLALLDAVQNKEYDLGKVAVMPKGVYSDKEKYEVLDLVKHSNSAYLSLSDDNQGNPVTDTTKWLCIIYGEDVVKFADEAKNAANDAKKAAGNATDAAGKADDARVLILAALEAANTQKEEMAAATAQAREVIASASEVEGLGLLPTGLEVSYPARITLGNQDELRIGASLTPSTVLQNIMFLCDNNAVSVAPDGSIQVNQVGKSTIHVVPTMKTALSRSIVIEVVAPTIRLVIKASMRLDASGNIRKN